MYVVPVMLEFTEINVVLAIHTYPQHRISEQRVPLAASVAPHSRSEAGARLMGEEPGAEPSPPPSPPHATYQLRRCLDIPTEALPRHIN